MIHHENKTGPSAGAPWQFIRPGEPPEPDAPVQEEPASPFRFVRPEPPADGLAPDYSASSEEFSKIIDKKMAARRGRNRRSFMVTMILLFGSTLGGTGWFVSSPERVTALKAAIADVRSVTDINAMREKYQKALDKIAKRRNHVNDASAMMGVDPADAAANAEDPYMDKEMRQIIGDEGGPTLGERNRKFAAKVEQMKNTGIIKEETPGPAAPAASSGL